MLSRQRDGPSQMRRKRHDSSLFFADDQENLHGSIIIVVCLHEYIGRVSKNITVPLSHAISLSLSQNFKRIILHDTEAETSYTQNVRFGLIRYCRAG